MSDSYHISLKTEVSTREEDCHTENAQVTGGGVTVATDVGLAEGVEGLSHTSEGCGDRDEMSGKGEGHKDPTPKTSEPEIHQEAVAVGRKTPK